MIPSVNNIMRIIILLLILITISERTSAGVEQRFVKINDRLAIAHTGMTLRLKNSLWPAATGVWKPTREDALTALRFLESPRGQQQIGVVASPVDIGPSLNNIRRTRFQVYGLIIQNRKHLLFDSAPDVSEPRVGYPDRWLEQSISRSVYDGGASIWFALYDVDGKQVKAASRRPY